MAFSGFAEIVQAPTTDRQTLLDAVRSLTTGRRTAVGSGILDAIDAIAEIDPAVAKSRTDDSPGLPPPPVPKGAYVPEIIVLLTDGASNAGPQPLDAAQQAVDRGIRVYTIGFGTADPGPMDGVCATSLLGREPQGGQVFGGGGGGGGGFRRGIDEDTLKQVADLTDGAYYPAESAAQLEGVFRGLPTNLILKHDVVEIGVGLRRVQRPRRRAGAACSGEPGAPCREAGQPIDCDAQPRRYTSVSLPSRPPPSSPRTAAAPLAVDQALTASESATDPGRTARRSSVPRIPAPSSARRPRYAGLSPFDRLIDG